MGGYSKIEESVDPKSDRVDVDLQTQKPEPGLKPEPKTDETEEAATTQVPAPRLSRNRSVASGHVFQTTPKRGLSMRRSSSVSERYCRIHDQNSATWPFPFQEEAEEEEEEEGDGEESKEKKKKKKKEKKKSKFLKACKRLFGLS